MVQCLDEFLFLCYTTEYILHVNEICSKLQRKTGASRSECAREYIIADWRHFANRVLFKFLGISGSDFWDELGCFKRVF